MRRAVGIGLDVVVAVLVLATLALPLGAMAAADRLPTPPPVLATPLPPVVHGDALPIRLMPAVVPGGPADQALTEGQVLTSAAAMRRAIDDLGRQLFVGGSTVEFWATLGDQEAFYHDVTIAYPFRYPTLDPLLDRQLPRPLSAASVRRLTDMAALLTVASARYPFDDAFPEAGTGASAAFALLDHARAIVDSCDVQLNLAFLASAEVQPEDDLIVTEFERAHRLCPGDPTPLWLLGQFQLGRTYVVRDDVRFGQILDREELTPRPVATFERLQRELPSSPAGWAGLADAELFLAQQADEQHVQPFTARHRYTHALALYDRAAELANDDTSRIGSDVGRARALAGLGRVGEAAVAAQRALDRAPGSGPLQTLRADILERAGDFSAAADELAQFSSGPVELPSGRAWPRSTPNSIGVESCVGRPCRSGRRSAPAPTSPSTTTPSFRATGTTS